MTATAVRRVLYPHTEGGFPPCGGCFTQKPDLAATAHQGVLWLLCRRCTTARASGRPFPLAVTGEVLEAQWERLARWHTNGEVHEGLIGRALMVLAGHLDEQAAADAFEELCEALLWRQQVEGPGFELASVEPEERDEDRLITKAHARVADALAALVNNPQHPTQSAPPRRPGR